MCGPMPVSTGDAPSGVGVATVLLVPSKPNSSPLFRSAPEGNAVDFFGLTVFEDGWPPDLVFFALKPGLASIKLNGAESRDETAGGIQVAVLFGWQPAVGNGCLMTAFDRKRPDAPDFHDPAARLAHRLFVIEHVMRAVLKSVDKSHDCFPEKIGPERNRLSNGAFLVVRTMR